MELLTQHTHTPTHTKLFLLLQTNNTGRNKNDDFAPVQVHLNN